MDAATILESWFSPFRQNIIGRDQTFASPAGRQKIVYADWTASGRGYAPIEEKLQQEILPFFANTHTHSNITGSRMSEAYEQAKTTIKRHVHANAEDALIFCGSGMTAAVNKLQRMLGLRMPERMMDYIKRLQWDETARPVVFVTHMEHHSNYVSWLETIATVEIIRPDESGNIDLAHLRELLEHHKHRENKIASVSACSNVTGIETPVHEIAAIMHAYDGLCFVDFAASAPYVAIDMHPPGHPGYLDAIFFSFHKFLGGPGTPGVLIFSSRLYTNRIPDQPGGGTLLYTNPWKVREYLDDPETREDGGTPPILQGIKAGLCILLKEEMQIKLILQREKYLLQRLFTRLENIPGIRMLAPDNRVRLGIISFTAVNKHYDEMVKQLNDQYGIQARGGCSCAGPYGHLLLNIDRSCSLDILDSLRAGKPESKPGWVRLSIHPTMTDAEIDYIGDAVESIMVMDNCPQPISHR